MNNYDVIIFDLDGTLSNSKKELPSQFNMLSQSLELKSLI